MMTSPTSIFKTLQFIKVYVKKYILQIIIVFMMYSKI